MFSELSGRVIVNSNRIGSVRLGFPNSGIIDSKYQRLVFENRGTLEFEGKASIGSGSAICCEGKIFFGQDFRVTASTKIVALNEVSFGKKVAIAWDVQ